MISATDRTWFIDPVPDMGYETKKALVFEERYSRNLYRRGQVVDVKGKYLCNSRLYWTTDVGDHVLGTPVNPMLPHYAWVIGIFTEELFVLGRLSAQHADQGGTLANPRPSAPMPSTQYTAVPQWVQAAPWAEELMPYVTDSEETRALKIQLARAKWEERYAQFIITCEGIEREWESYLEELREAMPTVPAPRFGNHVTAQALVLIGKEGGPEEGSRPHRTINQLRGLPEDAPLAEDNLYRMVLVSTTDATSYNSVDEANDVPNSNLLGSLNRTVGYNHTYAGITSSVFVRNLA